MVSSSKQAGGDLTEDTVQLVPGRRRAERKRRTNDAKDAEDAERARRASTSDVPAPVSSKRKSKKAKKSSKNEKSSSQDTGGGSAPKGTKEVDPVLPPPASYGDTSAKATQYLLNPQLMPTSRNTSHPVLTLTKLILGQHGLLIDTEQEEDAIAYLMKRMAASITHDIHSASFCETFCIEQMGKKDIAIAKSVSDAIESNFCDNLAGVAKLAEQWEHGELIEKQTFDKQLQQHAKSFETVHIQALWSMQILSSKT